MNRFRFPPSIQQQGAILLIVLWFIALISLLVASLAAEVRLAAKAVHYQQESLQDAQKIHTALRLSEWELMLQRMPVPPKQARLREDGTQPPYPLLRFNGDLQTLSHPLPKGIKVRIYDHAGLINIRRLSVQRWRELFRERIGEDDLVKLETLVQVWQDWIDGDDLKRANGAEKEFYKKQKPPYEPRNAQPETVEELLLLKDYAELFKGINIDAVFTVYGNVTGVNPNFATLEALSLLPGLNSGAANAILQLRHQKEIKSINDLNEILLPEQINKVRPWLQFSKVGSNFYNIAIQAESEALEGEENPKQGKQEKPPTNTQAYAYVATVEARGYALPPRMLRIDPYKKLPQAITFAKKDEFGKEKSKAYEPASFRSQGSSPSTSNTGLSPFGSGSRSSGGHSSASPSGSNASNNPFGSR